MCGSFTFSQKIRRLFSEVWKSENLFIRPIADDDDLWYAVVECEIYPEQEDYVNPAGFSIGRAYLKPEDNVPCVICLTDGTRIGYIVFRKWLGGGEASSWSFYLDKNFQGKGFGREAAVLAVRLLKAADREMPIKLSVEADNRKAQKLYQAIGFLRSRELDGDDLVFVS